MAQYRIDAVAPGDGHLRASESFEATDPYQAGEIARQWIRRRGACPESEYGKLYVGRDGGFDHLADVEEW